ncbi:MAG: HNH endonuclease [Proteobacteria bacterium]|nr:HNH endonuclease [Pseudomonadota bacterium]
MQKYCNASCQLKYEYETGKRCPKKTTQAANKALRNRTIKRWKEGNPTSHISKRGYRMLYSPQGSVPEHHAVWRSNNAWVRIPDNWVVHHINQDKLDNRIENLALMPEEYHLKLHAALRERDENGRFQSAA